MSTNSEAFDSSLLRRFQKEVGDRLHVWLLARRKDGFEVSPLEEELHARALAQTVLTEYAGERIRASEVPLTAELELRYRDEIHAVIYAAGRLTRLIVDEDIENVDINGYDNVFISRTGGRRERGDDAADSDEDLKENVRALATWAGLNPRPWDEAHPELDLTLPDGTRISAVMGVCARPSVSIRKQTMMDATLDDLVANGTMSADAGAFLHAIVECKFNAMISGATFAGKSVLLRAMGTSVGPEERIITIEQALELRIGSDVKRHPDCVEFETRVANSEGLGAVGMRQLVRRSLRMRPDRVWVGEVLGDEVIDMLNAMGQGNNGSLSTIHARDARHVLQRIANYALQSPERLSREATAGLIVDGLDFVVFMELNKDGHRQLVTILEITGYDEDTIQANEIYQAPGRPGKRTGPAVWTGVYPDRREDLEDAGWTPAPGGDW